MDIQWELAKTAKNIVLNNFRAYRVFDIYKDMKNNWCFEFQIKPHGFVQYNPQYQKFQVAIVNSEIHLYDFSKNQTIICKTLEEFKYNVEN